MIGILIASYGRLAQALISSVRCLFRDLERIRAVSIWPGDSQEEIKNLIQKNMAELDDGCGIVILTDILGGTPTNVSLSFVDDESVEVITGVNIPMLLTLSSYRSGRSLKEIGKLAKKSGRRSIILAKALPGLEPYYARR